MKTKIKESKYWVWALFAVFLAYQLFQHSLMWWYHDDYGYITLHYGTNVGTVGMEYGIGDIFEYLQWHYMNWGGRVLFYFFFIAVSKFGGLALMRVVQALIAAGIFYGIYLLVRGKGKDSVPLAATIILLWGTFSIDIARDGLYWFAASVSYTWPVLFLVLGILVYRGLISVSNKIVRNLVLFLLFFIAGFSQEQVAVLTIAYVGLETVFKLFQKQSVHWSALCGAVCGGLLEILAPGNFTRAGDGDNAAFAALSFREKLDRNFFQILSINVGRINFLFMLVVFCMVLMGCVILWRQQKNKIALTVMVLLDFSYPILLVGNYLTGTGTKYLLYTMFLWTVNAAALLVWYSFASKNELIFCLFGAGFCSQAMMVVSPALSYRSAIVFQYAMIIVAAIIWNDLIIEVRKGKCIKLLHGLVYCVFILACTANMAQISRGYYFNSKIHEKNDVILREASERIREGEEITEIRYLKVANTKYGNDMPYMPNKEYIQFWIKEYYELPSNVEFVYE